MLGLQAWTIITASSIVFCQADGGIWKTTVGSTTPKHLCSQACPGTNTDRSIICKGWLAESRVISPEGISEKHRLSWGIWGALLRWRTVLVQWGYRAGVSKMWLQGHIQLLQLLKRKFDWLAAPAPSCIICHCSHYSGRDEWLLRPIEDEDARHLVFFGTLGQKMKKKQWFPGQPKGELYQKSPWPWRDVSRHDCSGEQVGHICF